MYQVFRNHLKFVRNKIVKCMEKYLPQCGLKINAKPMKERKSGSACFRNSSTIFGLFSKDFL